jgi:hypothetical protein
MEQIEETPTPKTMGNDDAKLLSEIYDLLNDKELNTNLKKQARYSQLHDEAEKRKLL